MELLTDYDLVKVVNATITGCRDHRAAWNRFKAVGGSRRDAFRDSFRPLVRNSKNMKELKQQIGDMWMSMTPSGQHNYFFQLELDAIVEVLGESW